ncbi:N-acetylmuramoyl-L-alanine amidase [Mesosutterella sp. AGMB02718]|uniref:N-acetylmuramoyl-L-alanine amidase n=1 Tax=Mesosutterella faecium TaxID=2925194 RepID=A0ABT7IME9_9BURK|nr:N-acetylmuramoyl-L-alanine amidase [Mesosutterella sp. AGMB02718]MDL2059088.1 N-acetylmuramoyl-L-alanine amidase [Mesosutterella sp. AGMB02718]
MDLVRRDFLARSGGILLFSLLPWDIAYGADILDVRLWPASEYTRITIEHNGNLKFRSFVVRDSSPVRMVVDIEGLALSDSLKKKISEVRPSGPTISAIRIGQNKANVVRLVIDVKEDIRPEIFELAPIANYNRRLVMDLYPKSPRPVDSAEAEDDPIAAALGGRRQPAAESPSRSSSGTPSSGSPRITLMIDPGHGGEDPGATGSAGTHEKDVVLSIAQKLEKLVAKENDIQCFKTRGSDYFVPLGERVRLAQKARANLLVSIHADAWISPSASGSSVFALSERGASSAAAKWLAQKQNEADLIGGINLRGVNRKVQNVIVDMSNSWKISYSLALGQSVLGQLSKLNNLHKHNVEQAGFAVLKGQGIPSILVETAFISNPSEEQRLRNEDYQWQLAQGILEGIKKQIGRDKSLLQG